MKKVRLFAVAAAMGMFASTVAAAEPVVSTGYTTTWEGVEEIIKVDVGNKVVAPVTTIKVVKETRTTDSEYNTTADHLGIKDSAECWTGTEVSEDDNGDGYSDDQIYFIGTQAGYYTSVEEAVAVYGKGNEGLLGGEFLAPGASSYEENVYIAKYAGKHFADYDEVLAYAEDEGFVSYVYDEDGDLTHIYIRETEVSDKDGNVYGTVATEVKLNPNYRRADDDALEAVAKALVGETTLASQIDKFDVNTVAKYNYTGEKEANKAEYVVNWPTDHEGQKTFTFGEEDGKFYSVLVVEEYKGEYIPVKIVASHTARGFEHENGTNLTIDASKLTVLVQETAKGGAVYYNKLMTIDPAKATSKKWAPKAEMVWDDEVAAFLKEEVGYTTYSEETDTEGNYMGFTGFWAGNEYDSEDNKTPKQYANPAINGELGLETLVAPIDVIENDSDKIVITSTAVRSEITGLNTKTGKMTLRYDGTKELTVDAVKLDGTWYPAVTSEADLVTVVSKVVGIGKFGVSNVVDGLKLADGTDNTEYKTWYEATKELVDDVWSGFEGELPANELRGAKSEACSYVVSVESETVDATVTASEVDTTEAGVKTMTLTASVDGKAVATKDVKVVVAPRYERQYVNGKVAVLKSFYLDGTLYSEYHYDWAAKTYTATFYANDGVTVASTANGTL